jgi:hypothetical protein
MRKFLRLILWCSFLYSLLAVILPYILGIIGGLFVFHLVSPGISSLYSFLCFLFIVAIIVHEIRKI